MRDERFNSSYASRSPRQSRTHATTRPNPHGAPFAIRTARATSRCLKKWRMSSFRVRSISCIWSEGQRAGRARRAGLAGRGAGLSGLSRLSGLFGLSCWPDRQTHQANERIQIDQRNQMNQMNQSDERRRARCHTDFQLPVVLFIGGGSRTLAVRSRPSINGKIISGIDQGDV